MSFEIVKNFEKLISDFFGSKFAIATDSCTHAIELCLRYQKIDKQIYFPKNTYIGVPMLGYKLNLNWQWIKEEWNDYYTIKGTNIIDAAVLWKKNSYIDGNFMCISFQFQKHINIGKGGMILTNSKNAYEDLIKMSYDGRERDKPWREQDISNIGYHYYLTPESAQKGIEIYYNKFDKLPKLWTYKDYPDLSKMTVFNK
jgi:dTDP-4-amino-4,6-dideoxygalactose transaminase